MATQANLTKERIFQTLEGHRDLLRRCKVRKIGLFGSFVRDEQTDRSDIDFLVEFSEPDFDRFMELAETLEKLCGRKVELVSNGHISKYLKPYVEKEVRWHEVG